MKNIIMKRLNCTEKEAALIADDLNMVSPQLKSAVAAWLENGAIDETIVRDEKACDSTQK